MSPPDIRDGHVFLTDRPGWGADIDEAVLREHPWPGTATAAPRLFYGMTAENMAGPGPRR